MRWITPNLIWSAARITSPMKWHLSDKHLSFFHLNISSLPFHIEKLSTLITEHNLNFNFIGIIESGLILYKNLISSIQLPGYNIATPTECSNEVTLLHQKKWIKYKLRKYLKSKQLEPTFIEVFQNKKILSRLCI